MSIIYEALKKVGAIQAKTLELQIDKERKSKYKICLLYVLVLCFGFLIGNVIFKFFTTLLYKNFKSKRDSIYLAKSTVKKEFPTEEKRAINIYPELYESSDKKQAVSSSLILNGIFFSENQIYALINNRIIREGDVIEGATVKRITLDGVELEIEGSLFSLSNNTAQ